MTVGLQVVLLYIDPGLGFLALQMMVGSALGGLFYFRRAVLVFVKRLRGVIPRRGGSPLGQEGEEGR